MIDSLISLFAPVDLTQLHKFHFLRPWWLLSFAPLLLFYRSIVTKDDVLKQWQGHMSAKVIEHLTLRSNHSRKITPKSLFIVFVIISTLVMAGPSWTKKASPFFVNESVLIIALDVSDSMQKSDIQPTRLLRAKQKINELLALRGDAKTALIVYAGSAHIAMPITQDRKMIRHFLNVLDGDLLPESQSLPQSVIKPAKLLLGQTKSPSTLLILTDHTNSETVAEFSDFFSKKNHQLLIWALGENPDSGLQSPTGITSIQLELLSKLASNGNGIMIPFTHSSDDVDKVEHSIEKNMFSVNDKAQPWFDVGYLLLFLLIPLQVLWFRRGWTMQW